MRQIMLSLTVAAAVCAAATAAADTARLYGLAAAQGYAPAQNNLANLYARGLGVSKNEAEAARLLKLAGAHYTPASARNGSDFWAYSVRNDSPKLDSADLRYLLQVLRKQLYGCWNRPAGVSGAGADAPSAIVRFKLKQDGSLAGEPVVVGSHADPSQAVAKTALAAVKRCQPLRLPPNLYEFWKEVEINFVANAPI
jgi:TPR repeat protein